MNPIFHSVTLDRRQHVHRWPYAIGPPALSASGWARPTGACGAELRHAALPPSLKADRTGFAPLRLKQMKYPWGVTVG